MSDTAQACVSSPKPPDNVSRGRPTSLNICRQ